METQLTDEDSDKIASELSTEEEDSSLISPISYTSVEETIIEDSKTIKKLLKQVARLKLEIQEGKLESDRVTREYQMKFVQAEEDYAKQKHKHEMDALKAQTQANRNEKEFANIQAMMTKQIEDLKDKIVKMEQERPAIEEQIRQMKTQFSDEKELIISDIRYAEIKRMDAKSQSLKQHIQCMVRIFRILTRQIYEIVTKYRDTYETTQHENDILTENLRQTVSQLEKLRREHDFLVRSKQDSDTEYKSQISLLETKVSKLSSELQERLVEAEENRSKAQMFDTIKSKANEFENQSSQYQHKLEYMEATLLNTKHELTLTSQKLTTTTQQLEILKNDKMYLTKEVETLNSRVARAEDQNDQDKLRIKSLKAEKNELFNKFINHKDNSRTDYERNLQEEVTKIREQTRRDLERIKTSSREAYERENRMLREAKEHAESQLQRCTQQIAELKDVNDHLAMDYRTMSSNMEKQLTELRSQVKLKAFENERLSVSSLELNNNVKALKTECDVMRQKLDVLKTGYYNLQTETGKRIAELETELQACKNELGGYKDLEKELDRAIETYTPNIESEGEMRMFDEMSNLVPTNATRRLKYSLYLTRRVAELERTVTSCRQEIGNRDTRISQLMDRLQKTQQSLDHTSQPYNFLVNTIESKEKETDKYKTHIKYLENEVVELKNEIDLLAKRNKQLEVDIEKLIGQQNVINKLRGVLVEIRDEKRPAFNTNGSFQNLINKLKS